ncbi:MAG TPA: leucyl/phenylalanyl-tRNA--protein transferase [Sediminibacterium sp.]|nr:leucyl/phenylalanyl-tRNA--protein transferase [Sediminibacterium sp.]
MHTLSDKIWFPPVDDAVEDGLLAIGGDLRAERILLAYRKGIFPWFEGDVPLWWSPDPRFVLLPDQLKISKSMRQLIRNHQFGFRINSHFTGVIRACKEQPREGQDGTWITDEVEAAYTLLHQMGYAHSAEAWLNGELVGGLYGIRLGNVFFGESMFSKTSNASKFAFICYVEQLKKEGVRLIDCQVYTSHLESLGAVMIPRKEFIELLGTYGADR